MPQIKQVAVYNFDELSPKAKAKARDWMRESTSEDFSDTTGDSIISDAVECARLLGIDIATNERGVCVYWSGFSSQGDGASFAGNYKPVVNAEQAIREYAPQDEVLHKIAAGLDALQASHGNKLTAKITQEGRYCHEYTMEVELTGDEDGTVSEGDQDELLELLRDFARWVYKSLEDAYFEDLEEENIDSQLREQGFAFNADGTRFKG